ncbi:hypothetical protein [Mesorhizobium sp.]|uniref:hypothetical protein n=1 Tax=Mesorhizobium sp. TaxID=1871066 RepID=UPI0025C6E8C5|nr:hypothetical protein [Mesorhizobium sp.]
MDWPVALAFTGLILMHIGTLRAFWNLKTRMDAADKNVWTARINHEPRYRLPPEPRAA